MPQNIRRALSCPGCNYKITINLQNFEGKLQILCNSCNRLIANLVEETMTTSSFNSTQEYSGSSRVATSPRIPSVRKDKDISSAVSQLSESALLPSASSPQIPDTSEPSSARNRIGQYKLVKLIGRGAMGEIYLARHVDKNYEVAIKLLAQKLQKKQAATLRFEQEANVHRRLKHSNIVRIMEMGCHNDRLYLIMEYIEGESLEEILEARKTILAKHTIKIAIAVAQALEHALEQRIIHRDLKPANIMIDRRTRKVKLTDFGLGKIIEEKGVTVTGQVMGTAYYMPPEQIHNAKKVDHLADIYSLGATIYHMLSGQPPYSEIKTTLSILRAKVTGEPVPLKSLNNEIPDSVVRVVEKAMAHKCENRYQTPTEMIQDMKNVLQELD